MAHIHTQPGQYDLTASAIIIRTDAEEPRMLLLRHKTLGVLMQPGGHVELDEDPWQAITHELREETGYDIHQLKVLQPKVCPPHMAGVKVHPQPVLVSSFPYEARSDHMHTDLTFAFVTDQDPSGPVDEGESTEFHWVTAAQLAALSTADVLETIREVGMYIMDTVVVDWVPVETSQYDFAG